MKFCIFHIPWELDKKFNVASDIRPIKMYDAFKEIGYNVEVIWGKSKQRKIKIEKVKSMIKNGIKFDFLYSESSTYPTTLTDSHHLPLHPLLDFNFFSFCKKNNIPIGLFLRDVHWNSSDIDRFSGVKFLYTKLFHIYDILFYNKLLDILYLPHLGLRNLIKYLSDKIKAVQLMPGADNIESNLTYNNLFLYVGGIKPHIYDVSEMLEAFRYSNAKLLLCCRKHDWNLYQDYYNSNLSENVKVIHKNAEEIREEYAKASYVILFYKQQEYRDFALPYKLFEYIGNEKPIVTSGNSAASEFIEENDIGFSINFDVSSLRKFLNNLPVKSQYKKKISNIKRTKIKNLWTARAKKVANDLIRIGTGKEK